MSSPISGRVVFFFQAEDGIRDLVRSRGLGDVYKRQAIRTIELVDATGVMRATRSVFVPAGPSRVSLDFDIIPGLNYRLMVTGTTGLWRNFGDVSYPYQIGSVATITTCLLYTSPSPRDRTRSRMPSSA